MSNKRMFAGSVLCLLGFGLTLITAPVAAQVFDLGVSDSTLFDNVISSTSFDNSQSIGGDGSTTQLNITTGDSIGFSFNVNEGSEVNVSGGFVSGLLEANAGSELNISGGSFAFFDVAGESFDPLDANAGSVVNIIDGDFGFGFDAFAGSVVNISGGAFRPNFDAFGEVNISGGVFDAGSFNGTSNFEAFSGSEVNISGGSFGDGFLARSGSQVNISGGEIGSDFTAQSGSEVTISGGDIEFGFTLGTDAVLNLSGGSLVGDLFVPTGSQLNFSDGIFEDLINVNAGGELNFTGGEAVFVGTSPGSEVNISGGSLGILSASGVVNVSGGTFGGTGFEPGISVSPGGEINLFGSEFVLDGTELDGSLTIDEAFTITDRDVTLSGLLEDGTPFSFGLNSTFGGPDDEIFDPDATLTVTLVSSVPEPGSLAFLGLGSVILLGRRRKTRR